MRRPTFLGDLDREDLLSRLAVLALAGAVDRSSMDSRGPIQTNA